MRNHTRHITTILNLSILMIIIIGVTSSCVPETPIPTPTEALAPTLVVNQHTVPTQTVTPRPTPTPTLPPLSSEGNPITIGFILTPDQTTAIDAAEDIALFIAKITGYSIESLFYPDFQSLSAAALSADVHLFWLEPFEYLFLNWENAAEVMLLSNHLGVYAYGVQFMAHENRGFQIWYDPETSASFGDPIEILQQFSGTRPCFINPDSVPGYYVPLGLLANTSTPTLDPVFTYNYNATIRALYVQGICDFGITYALIGDPFTTGDLTQNIPDAKDQIPIIWQSEGIIPNKNLSASPSLPVYMRFRVQEAMINLSEDMEMTTLLSTALVYEVAALRSVQDSFYNPLRAAIIPLELDLESITQPGIDQ